MSNMGREIISWGKHILTIAAAISLRVGKVVHKSPTSLLEKKIIVIEIAGSKYACLKALKEEIFIEILTTYYIPLHN